LSNNVLNPGLGAISQAVGSVVAKAQAKGDEANEYNLP